MNEVATQAGFGNSDSFALALRGAKLLANSRLMPERFRTKYEKDGTVLAENDGTADCMIVLEMSQRLGASPLMVAQNLYLVHGTPAWSAQFVISCVNSCGRFSALRYETRGDDPKSLDFATRAWAIEKGTDQRLDGPWIDWDTVKREGWDNKSGSKWKSIPGLMFRYRAAAWWGRLYAPELTMGLRTAEEERDIIDIAPADKGSDVMREINAQLEAPADPEVVNEHAKQDSPKPERAAKVKPVAKQDPAADLLGDDVPPADYAKMIAAAKNLDECEDIGFMLDDEDDADRLRELLNKRRVEIEKA